MEDSAVCPVQLIDKVTNKNGTARNHFSKYRYFNVNPQCRIYVGVEIYIFLDMTKLLTHLFCFVLLWRNKSNRQIKRLVTGGHTYQCGVWCIREGWVQSKYTLKIEVLVQSVVYLVICLNLSLLAMQETNKTRYCSLYYNEEQILGTIGRSLFSEKWIHTNVSFNSLVPFLSHWSKHHFFPRKYLCGEI